MTSTVVDYTGRISPDQLGQHQVAGVVRYLSWWHRWGGQVHAGINPKVILRPEYEQLRAGGASVTLNWEFDARDWLGGGDAGTYHGQEAVAQARELGHGPGLTIIGSADFDMTPEQWAGAGYAYARAYAGAVQGGGYRPGVYGPWDVLEWVHHAGVMDVFWQAGMSTAWSGGRNAARWPGAQLRQTGSGVIAGEQVDFDIAYVADWGQAPGLAIPLPPVGDIMTGWTTVSRGHTTPDQTRTVQGLLLARGYPVGSRSGGPDGDWGDATDASLRRFQVAHRVNNSITSGGAGDGQAGYQTMRALLELA